jgi:prolyl-tRNA editing enzyme YbaK/EbsC (Cys-tRNA(Pro) deacylase)
MTEPHPIERLAWATLDRLSARYEVMACDPAFADTAEFCARYGIPLGKSANAILVASKKEPKVYAVCLVLATTKLDVNKKVSELLGVKKLSFASAEETVAVTRMMIGGVTPFGLPDGLPIYVDSRVQALDEVIVGGGSRSSKLRIAPEVFLRVPNCRFVEGLALAREAAT